MRYILCGALPDWLRKITKFLQEAGNAPETNRYKADHY